MKLNFNLSLYWLSSCSSGSRTLFNTLNFASVYLNLNYLSKNLLFPILKFNPFYKNVHKHHSSKNVLFFIIQIEPQSRVFNKLLYGQKAYSNQQYNNNLENDLPPERPVEAVRSTRRSIFGRKESVTEDSNNMNDSKRSREESITGGLLRYSKSKKFKENKDTKLKLFLKRGSEPQLNGIPIAQIVNIFYLW